MFTHSLNARITTFENKVLVNIIAIECLRHTFYKKMHMHKVKYSNSEINVVDSKRVNWVLLILVLNKHILRKIVHVSIY